VATTPASAVPAALVAGRAATASVPLAQAVKVTAGDLGPPEPPATGPQAPGPAGGAAAHAPAAPGQAGRATALRRLGLRGADVKPAPLLLLSSLPPSPLARLLVFRPALATVFVLLLLLWTLRRLLPEAAREARARVRGLLLWLGLRLRLWVFLALLCCCKELMHSRNVPGGFRMTLHGVLFPTDCNGQKA
jgi:hypothetical protein